MKAFIRRTQSPTFATNWYIAREYVHALYSRKIWVKQAHLTFDVFIIEKFPKYRFRVKEREDNQLHVNSLKFSAKIVIKIVVRRTTVEAVQFCH